MDQRALPQNTYAQARCGDPARSVPLWPRLACRTVSEVVFLWEMVLALAKVGSRQPLYFIIFYMVVARLCG
jgi:hypothetical protein